MELIFNECDPHKEVRQSLDKQLEEIEKGRIWSKYQRELKGKHIDELKEIVSSYSFPERVQSYFCKHSHIRYKLARKYLASQEKKQN